MRGPQALLPVIMLAVLSGPGTAGARTPASPALTLERALRLAREQSESFLVVSEQLVQARLARDQAWAALLPTLKAGGSFTHADKEISFLRGTSSDERVVIQRQDAFAGEILGKLTVFKGTAIFDLLQAYSEADAATQTALWTRNRLSFEVARAYFAVLSATNLLAAMQRSLQTAREHLAATRARRTAGEALGLDVTRARIQVVSATSDLTKAANVLQGSLDYLAYLVGLEPPLRVQRQSVPGSAGPASQTSGRGEPAGDRPDVRASELNVKAARRAVTASWMDYLPTLAVSMTYAATQNTGFSGDPDNWKLMVTLDWLLFDGGLRRVARLESASKLREARLKQALLLRGVKREVRQARRDLRTALASLATAQERLSLAQESRSQVLGRYQGGLATSLELVEADDALRQAEVARVSEELELYLRGLDLLFALGLDPLGREAAP